MARNSRQVSGSREFVSTVDRYVDEMYTMSWRGPFEGFSATRRFCAPEPSFSQGEVRWRGPFEGVR